MPAMGVERQQHWERSPRGCLARSPYEHENATGELYKLPNLVV